MLITDFFFLRPLWLLALIPAGVLVVVAWRRFAQGNNTAWRALVDEHLLPELSVKAATAKHQRWQPIALTIALTAVIIALAGPAWEKIDVPSYQSRTPTVVVLSLAQSMNSNDVTPSRIVRAGHKLQDILDLSEGGDAGLIVYADRPFVASPLTSDARVIQEMLPELSTDLMPVLGNRLDLALAEATNLLKQADARSGRIVVLADDLGLDSAGAVTAARNARASGYEVDVVGVGTRSGATLVTASGRAITDANGQTMIASYEESDLRQLAIAGGGDFVSLTADSSDIEQLFRANTATGGLEAGRKSGIEVDTWSDMGYWLLLIPVLLVPLVFRRNVIMVLPIVLAFGLATPTQQASASELADFFSTPDQQASAAFEAQDYETAAEGFENGAWKASAHFRNNDFEAAADAYATLQTDDATYNRGNALAKAGRLEEALDVYDQFLEKNSDDQDAQFNRDLVAKLLEQQQQDQQDQQDQDSDASEEENQSGGDSADSEQQESSQSGQDGKSESKPDSGSDPQDSSTQSQEPEEAQEPQASSDQTTSDDPSGEESDELSDSQEAFSDEMNDAIDKETQSAEQRDESEAQPGEPAASVEISEQDQANEQLLRRVPDDTTGLLRARIRQHYARMRNSN